MSVDSAVAGPGFLGVGLYVDFRNPPQWPRSDAALYAENIELIAAAEQLGFASVWFSEHHFADDGYAPSPLMLAAAAAKATTRMRLGTAVAVLPLYHPLRFAEDVAVLDILAAGRVELGVGVGWRREEFEAFGVPLRRRGTITDGAISMMRRLWAGEPHVLADGQRLQLSPQPVQPGGPPLWIGGSGDAALRRAARFGAGIVVSGFDAPMDHAYARALAEAGCDASMRRVASNLRWFMVAKDPERTFASVAPYVINWCNHYAAWMVPTGGPFAYVANVGELRARGLLTVVTPDDGLRELRTHIADRSVTYLNVKARPPGMPLDEALEHLELFASAVLPGLAA